MALFFHKNLSGCEWACWPLNVWENHQHKGSNLTPEAQTDKFFTSSLLLHYLPQNTPLAMMHVNRSRLKELPTGCPSTNCATFEFLYPHENVVLLRWIASPWHRRRYVKIAFSVSLSLSISIVQYAEASLTDLIHTLGHTWVDSRRKERVFNPILPARWHCSGKLLVFLHEGDQSHWPYSAFGAQD